MKQLRFRAWDKVHEQMVEIIALGFLSSEAITPTRALKFPEQCELMQYTGLKDKNGKEIYEGDILKSETGQTAPVEWIPVGFWGLNHYIKHPGPGKVLKKSFGRQSKIWRIRRPESWKVIGNVYENPEIVSELSGTVSSRDVDKEMDNENANTGKTGRHEPRLKSSHKRSE